MIPAAHFFGRADNSALELTEEELGTAEAVRVRSRQGCRGGWGEACMPWVCVLLGAGRAHPESVCPGLRHAMVLSSGCPLALLPLLGPTPNGKRACGWVLGGRQSPQDRPAQGAAEPREDRPTRGLATPGAAFWAREPVLTTPPSRAPGSGSSPACRRWTSPRTSSSQGPHPWTSSGEAGGRVEPPGSLGRKSPPN